MEKFSTLTKKMIGKTNDNKINYELKINSLFINYYSRGHVPDHIRNNIIFIL